MRVCIVSQTYLTQEPRVLRQIDTFRKRGWRISVTGYPGFLPVPDDWDLHDMTDPPPVVTEIQEHVGGPARAPAEDPVTQALRPPVSTLPAFLTGRPSNFPEKVASLIFWRAIAPLRAWMVERRDTVGQEEPEPAASTVTCLVASLLERPEPRAIDFAEATSIFYREPKHVHFRDVMVPGFPPADLVIAHDYNVLPLADELARRWGAPIVMDIHEYAAEQYAFPAGTPERRYFDHVTRPMIDAFHRHYFAKIRAATCVSVGIADQVAQDYALPTTPTVVRSTPFYSEQPFRPAGATIEVMYHGIVDAMRHLEVGVRSLALWRPEFRFTIRGPGPESYIVGLRDLALELGVADRLSIEPAVPFNDLIPTANKADIGYLAFMNFSRQRQFASPNKFFEYVMAGLALAVMDVPELAPVITANGNGAIIPDFTAEAIAACINSFDATRIDACKKASLALAKELCWEREQDRMIAAYGLAELEVRGDRRT
jgi:glycosyltransferase involved in cell wall biosynthesis